ncbi:MAG: HupE/UreJ family protein [Kofleriaceae bacterium]|nr:HupE/UreJ family protein [Kofleriaceae bacterium]
MRYLLAFAIFVASLGTAHAHQSSIKYTDVTIDGPHAKVAVTIAPGDVTEPLGLANDATPTVAQASVPAAAAYVATWVTLALPDGAPCPPAPPSAAPDPDGKFIVVSWEATCPSTIQALALDFTRFFAVDARHEAILSVHAPGERMTPSVVRASQPRVVIEPGGTSLLGWIRHGMDHIYGGLDHLAFVLALLLVVVIERAGGAWRVRSPWAALRSTAVIITAFTIAHSFSLIAASLGWFRLPSRLVESLIAVSIIYTAVENVVRPDVWWRFALTFGFGLIHGLGFASVLEELLPRTSVIVPLVTFNIGVEVGQLTIVLLALPVFWGLARVTGAQTYRRWVLAALGLPLVLLGTIWLVERV